jgi:hypothetical protein
MVRLVLTDLAIEVVRGEQWIGKDPRELRADPDMRDSMLPILLRPDGGMLQGLHVFFLLVENKDERLSWRWRTFRLERGEDIAEGSFNRIPLEIDSRV